MWETWWSFGAGRRFIEDVCEKVGIETSVVVAIPRFGPEGLVGPLRKALAQDDPARVAVHDLALEELDRPEEILESVDIDNDRPDGTSPRPEVLLLTGLFGDDWRAWKQPVLDYVHRRRNLPCRPPVLVAVVPEFCVSDMESADVGFVVCPWRDRVTRFDVEYFARLVSRVREPTSLRDRLRFRLVAELAVWDAWLAARLAEERLEDLLRPTALLRRLAEERGFSCGFDVDDRWVVGLTDLSEGSPEENSLSLAVNDRCKEIERRVWRAEVGLLFPRLEEHRVEIVRRHHAPLNRRLQAGPGSCRFESVEEAEFRDVYDCLCGADDELGDKERVSKLRAIRNAIAHMRVVPPEALETLGP